MTLSTKMDAAAWNRVVWMLAALIAIAGWNVVVAPRERTLNDTGAHARDLYESANANESKVRRASQLHVVEARVEGDLITLTGQANSSRLMATALELLNEEAKRYHVEIRSVVPAPVPQVSAPAVASPGPIVDDPVSIGVRGRFRDIVGFVADLPRHNALIDVQGVDLTALGQTAAEPVQPTLDITLRVSIDRVRTLSSTEDTHVAATVR